MSFRSGTSRASAAGGATIGPLGAGVAATVGRLAAAAAVAADESEVTAGVDAGVPKVKPELAATAGIVELTAAGADAYTGAGRGAPTAGGVIVAPNSTLPEVVDAAALSVLIVPKEEGPLPNVDAGVDAGADTTPNAGAVEDDAGAAELAALAAAAAAPAARIRLSKSDRRASMNASASCSMTRGPVSDTTG